MQISYPFLFTLGHISNIVIWIDRTEMHASLHYVIIFGDNSIKLHCIHCDSIERGCDPNKCGINPYLCSQLPDCYLYLTSHV